MLKQLGEKMTVDELAQILKKMYDDALEGEQTTQIHLFGIQYAPALNRVSVKQVKARAGIRECTVEINAGRRLARYVDLKP
jgi:hypothetical protein